MLTVLGEQTAAGLIIDNDGVGFTVTTTGLIAVQLPRALLI